MDLPHILDGRFGVLSLRFIAPGVNSPNWDTSWFPDLAYFGRLTGNLSARMSSFNFVRTPVRKTQIVECRAGNG